MVTETRYSPGARPSHRYLPLTSVVTVLVPVFVQTAGPVGASSRAKLTVTGVSDGRAPSLSSMMPLRMRVSSQTVPAIKFPTTAGRTTAALPEAVGRGVAVGLGAAAGSA